MMILRKTRQLVTIAIRSINRTGMMAGVLLLAITASMAAIQVEVNGNPLYSRVPPMQVRGRTMVPLRGIFESLDAQVDWNASTRMITATKGDTDVQLGIGQTQATLNGRTVPLDVPAMIVRGSTMVPLRFVSEALGADVKWLEATQTVSIYTDQQYATDVVVLPAGTVIPVTLNNALSSASNNQGDGISVTVRSTQDGDAEFPRGTKLAGIVSDVQRKGTGQPGMLDLTFREAQLPDGRKAGITGSLISLDDKSVTRSSDGRLIANDKTSNDRLKFIAIGTGAGLIIGKLLDKNLIAGGLLGAAAGYIYSEYHKDKVKSMDVTVPEGTTFGVQLNQTLAYNASHAYVAARADYRRTAAANVP
ncbi:MAG TPA: copper amine oxidase N-terminal domain-containing protein [Armatimonadota bacterium]